MHSKVVTKLNPKVVDLSHWQGKSFNFQEARKEGILGVISKATGYENGGLYMDPDYQVVVQEARKAGMLVAGYHFFGHGNVTAQMEYFLKHAYITDNMFALLDHEKPPKGTRPQLADLTAACDYLEHKLGRKQVIYSGNDIKEELGNTNNTYLGSHRLMLASYTTNPSWQQSWKNYWLWQYTGDGAGRSPHAIGGIGNKIDVSHYDGSDEQLTKEWVGGVDIVTHPTVVPVLAKA